MASRKKLDFQYFGIHKPQLSRCVESVLGQMYKEIREFDIDYLRAGFLRVIPIFFELQGDVPRIVKKERILVFDRDYQLMVEVQPRRLVQYPDVPAPRELSAGQTLRSALLSLEHPPDVRYIVYVQLWSEPFPSKSILTYIHRDNGVCVYDKRIKWVSFPELGNGQEDEFAEYDSPIAKRHEAEENTKSERSRKHAEGERMLDAYIAWPVFLRFLLPIFGKLKPPHSDDPDIQEGIIKHKERLGLYGGHCEMTDKTRR